MSQPLEFTTFLLHNINIFSIIFKLWNLGILNKIKLDPFYLTKYFDIFNPIVNGEYDIENAQSIKEVWDTLVKMCSNNTQTHKM